MNSKEALKELKNNFGLSVIGKSLCDIISQDIEKYKKAIKILKGNFPIKFLGYNKYGAKPYEIMINGYIQGFDKEPYELLKEVLGYESCNI